ncbi:MAG: AAA family ATPase [Sporichthyaceae bacterium]
MSDQHIVTEALGLAVGAGVPALLWGAPGTGKTSVIRALGEAMDLPCEIVIASIREPADFAGLPIVQAGEVVFAPPSWARRLAGLDRGLLFLDEISTAPPAVQAALLRVVLERTVGDLTLPVGIRTVAAANPPEQAADGWDLSAPLANRFVHLDWPVDARTVAEGFAGGWPAPTVATLPADWQDRVPTTRSWIAGFVGVRPAAALAVPGEATSAGRAWPSPRSWDMAARLLAAARAAGSVAGGQEDVVALLIRGCVGDGVGVEFLNWLAEGDLPDPEVVLADPDSFKLPERGDRAFAALTSIAAAVAAKPTTERWTAAWQVFGRAGDSAPDAAAVAARTLVRARPEGAPVPPEVARFAPLLRDAGLLA